MVGRACIFELAPCIGGSVVKSAIAIIGIAFGLLAASAVSDSASAQQSAQPQAVAVVELFTSQGCSSCPPADKLFVDLARDPRLIVLTLPVDYWDYLGWKDTLAKPDFSSRQRHYAQLRGDNTVYTPQAVVNGAMHVIGTNRAKIEKLSVKSSLSVAITIDDGSASPRINVAAAPMPKDITRDAQKSSFTGSVFLVPVTRSISVTIARGENRGKLITYANVARGIHRLGDWNGAAVSFDMSPEQHRTWIKDAGADGFVILVQADNSKSGKILGAARSSGLTPPAS